MKRKPEDKIQKELSLFMNEIREDHFNEPSPGIMTKKYGITLVPYLQKYLTDSNSFVRWHSQASLLTIGMDSNSVSARQEIVYTLLKQIQNEDALNKGNIARRLCYFVASDFTPESKEILKKFLSKAIEDKLGNLSDIERYIFFLVGVADVKSELPALKDYIDKHSKEFDKSIKEKELWYNQLTWIALMARARMGVKEDIKKCIDLVESEPDESTRLMLIRSFLSYVRQPEVVEYIYSYLKIDKTLPDLGPDAKGGTYAQYAMGGLKQMLKDFPGDESNPNDADKCRKWMAEQKEWNIIR